MSLPQKAPGNCINLREKDLHDQKGIYQLAPRPPLPMPLVNMSVDQLKAHHLRDPFARQEFLGYGMMLQRNKNFSDHWRALHPEEITTFQEYGSIYKEFRSMAGSPVSTFEQKQFHFQHNCPHSGRAGQLEPFSDVVLPPCQVHGLVQ